MTEADLVGQWAVALATTLLLEIPIAAGLLGPSGVALGRRVAMVATAQLATHPIVWFVIPSFGLSRAPFLVVAESFALVTEAIAYATVLERVGLLRALLASGAANAASFGAGLVLGWAGVW